MKYKTNILISILIFFIFSMISCNKDPLQNDINIESNKLQSRHASNDYAFTTTDVSLVDGMLYFKDSTVLEGVIESSLNKDSVFLDSYLSELGLSKKSDFLDNAYPWNPAFQKFNERFGFNS